MEIGQRIRALRESKNMTQSQLADTIHVSKSFMNRMEQGSSRISIEYVCSIAGALDVYPQDILCDILSIHPMTIQQQNESSLLPKNFLPGIKNLP